MMPAWSSFCHQLRIERSSAHHAVVISAPYAEDVWLSGGTTESLPDTIEHRRKETGRDERGRAHSISGCSRPLSPGPADRIDGHVFYHGVEGQRGAGCEQPRRYSAGVLLLDADDPRKVVYRSAHSILAPEMPAELAGVVPGVVFPTGVDVRRDGRLDVYYGMADSRIGVAYAGLTDLLMPAQAHAA